MLHFVRRFRRFFGGFQVDEGFGGLAFLAAQWSWRLSFCGGRAVGDGFSGLAVCDGFSPFLFLG